MYRNLDSHVFSLMSVSQNRLVLFAMKAMSSTTTLVKRLLLLWSNVLSQAMSLEHKAFNMPLSLSTYI